jgi:hypothetical protein
MLDVLEFHSVKQHVNFNTLVFKIKNNMFLQPLGLLMISHANLHELWYEELILFHESVPTII